MISLFGASAAWTELLSHAYNISPRRYDSMHEARRKELLSWFRSANRPVLEAALRRILNLSSEGFTQSRIIRQGDLLKTPAALENKRCYSIVFYFSSVWQRHRRALRRELPSRTITMDETYSWQMIAASADGSSRTRVWCRRSSRSPHPSWAGMDRLLEPEDQSHSLVSRRL